MAMAMACPPIMAGDGGGGGGASNGGVDDDVGYGTWEGLARNRSELLNAIYRYYERALDLLPLDEIPALAPLLLRHGVCFGFADPVTNIIANTVSSLPNKETKRMQRKGKRKRLQDGGKRRRESVLSDMLAVPGELPHLPRPVESRAIAERSLEGLIVFLTTYFRYLRTMDALRYLRLANADLLVAVQLIEHDRHCLHKDAFIACSHTTKIAIKCAALSARQPDLDAFLTASFSLACRTIDASRALGLGVVSLAHPARRRLSVRDIRKLRALLKLPFDAKESYDPMYLAASRLYGVYGHTGIGKMPTGMAGSLRCLLLDRIHALYLKAISRLPMHDLRNRHHRGLLKAGYCYGSLDPVSNIILNTIWYDTMFPVHQHFQVSMLCPDLFVRIKSSSLDGLVAFLCSCIPTVSKHDAMLYLLKSNVKVRKAISIAKQEGHAVVSTWDMDAHKAAAGASWHPEPDAYVKFATECLPSIQRNVKSSLKSQGTISSEAILSLSSLLSSSCSCPAKSLCSPMELSKEALEMCSSYWEKFTSDQGLVQEKIKAALLDYEQSKGILYELQIVCGRNENVGSERSLTDDRHLFSHVNFWASTNGSDSPTLFFAEFSNDVGDNDQQSICCSLLDLSTNVRCCYCELRGIRIVHPAFYNYQGSDMDFEKIALGEHSINMNNERIISHGKLRSSMTGIIFNEDYIYFDPARDAKFIRVMNRCALEDNIGWGEVDKTDLRLRERCNIKDTNLEGDFKDRQRSHPDLVHSKSEKEAAFAYEQSALVIDANHTKALYLVESNEVVNEASDSQNTQDPVSG